MALLAVCTMASPARAAGPAFTDANWVGLPGANGTQHPSVNAIVMDTNGNLYAGGSFTNAGGANANYVAEWNGVTWMPLGSGMNDQVRALTFDPSGNLYAGGFFTTAGGLSANYIARWDGTNWSSLGSGMIGPVFPFFEGVYALACDGAGNVFAGGSFTNAGGITAMNVAQWNGSNWSVLGPGMNGAVFALIFDPSGNLYAGGGFGNAGGVSANNIAKWDGSAWSALGSGMPQTVFALCLDTSGNFYAGGNAITPGPPVINLSKWNGTNWFPLQADGFTYSLAFRSPNLYAAGGFHSADGVNANNIAQWNGIKWSALGSGINGQVNSLAIDSSGNLCVGGAFSTAGTNAAANIAKVLLVGPTPNQLTLAQPVPPTNIITFLGTPGYTYALDSTTDLAPPINWIPQATNTASTNNATTAGYLTFTNLSVALEAFYRIRSVP